jgi:hypothetical protein
MPFSLLRNALIGLALVSPASSAQFAFAPGASPEPTTFTWDIDVADLDGDGDLDLIQSRPFSDAGISVHLNDGSGSYDGGTVYDVGDWADATDVGDVDGDGDSDLVVATHQFQSGLVTLFNDGGGAFTVGPSNPGGSLPEDVALADLDGDGDLDAVMSNWSEDSISFLYGDGAGHFTGELQIAVEGGNGFAVAVPDLDADGDIDPIMVCFGDVFPGNGRLHVFMNPGNGAFREPVTYLVDLGAWAVDTGDIDGDGDTDVMTTNRNTATVSFFFNDGAGNLGTQVTAPVGTYPVDGHLADLDGDGDLDVASGSNLLPELHILENDGSGSFSPALVLSTPHTHYAGDVGDMDGDGDVDLWGGGSSGLAYFVNLASAPSAWSDQGCALAGLSGAPLLEGTGVLSDGSSNSAELSNAAPSATAGLFLALGPVTPAAFKGGTLKPIPFLIDPVILNTSSAGEIPIPFVMPSGIPPGTELWIQWAIQDAAAVKGVALSNAILGVTP